jgi:hypothetical protein
VGAHSASLDPVAIVVASLFIAADNRCHSISDDIEESAIRKNNIN